MLILNFVITLIEIEVQPALRVGERGEASFSSDKLPPVAATRG